MKSKIVSEFPYNKVDISKFQKKFLENYEDIEKEMKRLVKNEVRWVEGKIVHSGDMVVCSLKSENEKFNKTKIKLVVESGMFHLILEKELVGMQSGETKKVQIDGGQVEITVIEITNRLEPPVTDQMIQELAIKDIVTVDKYRGYLLDRQKEKTAPQDSYYAVQYVLNEVVDNSELILNYVDWIEITQLELDHYRTLSKQEGYIIEEMNKEDFEGKIPVSSYFELVSIVQQNGWKNLEYFLLGCHYAKAESYEVTKTEYEDFIKEYMETWHVSEEDAKESNTYQHYRTFTLIGYYLKKVQEYVIENIYL